jgi:hypothetical protein
VTFCYSLFTFVWMVASRWRWKLVLFVILVGLGIFTMPGPTLLLALLLTLPYMLFLTSRRSGRLDPSRLMLVLGASMVFLVAFVALAMSLFPARLEEITSANDATFFYRVQGPALAGIDILKSYPFAGPGLTGEPFVENQVVNTYVRSPSYSTGWRAVASELLVNYFWLHWIYLGLIFGLILIGAVSAWFLAIGAPSPAFCWIVWAIGTSIGRLRRSDVLGGAVSGGAAAVLHQRRDSEDDRRFVLNRRPRCPDLAWTDRLP